MSDEQLPSSDSLCVGTIPLSAMVRVWPAQNDQRPHHFPWYIPHPQHWLYMYDIV